MDNPSGRLDGPFADDGLIHPCTPTDFEAIYEIINDAAQAYRGVISADRWKEPYMPREELREEIAAGLVFRGDLPFDLAIYSSGHICIDARTKSPLPSIYKREEFPSWEKRG